MAKRGKTHLAVVHVVKKQNILPEIGTKIKCKNAIHLSFHLSFSLPSSCDKCVVPPSGPTSPSSHDDPPRFQPTDKSHRRQALRGASDKGDKDGSEGEGRW